MAFEKRDILGCLTGKCWPEKETGIFCEAQNRGMVPAGPLVLHSGFLRGSKQAGVCLEWMRKLWELSRKELCKGKDRDRKGLTSNCSTGARGSAGEKQLPPGREAKGINHSRNKIRKFLVQREVGLVAALLWRVGACILQLCFCPFAGIPHRMGCSE